MYAIEYLAKVLKTARKGKKLSQRGLGKSTGMPQAQISKIENAAVDMKASTLIGLARGLDLEVVLVPREYLPAVKSIMAPRTEKDAETAPPRPAYGLDREDDDG